MKHAQAIIVAAALIAGNSAIAQTPTWTVRPDNVRCPSKWGAGDERGAGSNHAAGSRSGDHLANHPRVHALGADILEHRRRVRGGDKEGHPDAHVEGFFHLGARDPATLGNHREHRRRRPGR